MGVIRRAFTTAVAGTAALAVLGTPGTGPAAASAHLSAGAPRVDVLHSLHGSRWGGQQQSTNWSGYVAAAGSYHSISGTWRIPTVHVTADDRYSATWVGIGGVNNPDLIQAGTEQDSVGGLPVYRAWTEILPEPESQITSMVVNPGDLMRVTISVKTSVQWTIVVKDVSTGQSFTRKTSYGPIYSTAEWIHEAPTVGGLQSKMAQTSTVGFDLGFTNGRSIANAGALSTYQMVDANGNPAATPGGLDGDGDGFSVGDGGVGPPPPAS